jgi:shikimate dehydrogenase
VGKVPSNFLEDPTAALLSKKAAVKDFYAIFGKPISHSQSPLIHRLFSKQTQQNITYSAISVSADNFAQGLNEFQAYGGKGANVTSPLKEKAFFLVNSLSDRARQAQAINTIVFNPGGQRTGDNTDGIGFIKDLTLNQAFNIKNTRILILGAGGAVRGILGPLLAAKPAEVIIVNRTVSKAFDLVKKFAAYGQITVSSLSLLGNAHFDLVINATSACLKENKVFLTSRLIKNTFCYDLKYGKNARFFLTWAKTHGARLCSDGLGMLIEQAAESFHVWRGIKPQTQPILIALSHRAKK